ncbi:PrgI family protein [Candidatus Peregrinibacteria bacterium]|jgi:hypothetical protein|nr:PrgI family protein [Candidatus Peregrinibacteria bacterium]MBT5468689.1 PrgI family protein [Candidatus Peregrinibacteria bacterium]MBT7337406.1 PrgI family protein [Candidatus Peregrinibacteria bacterium]
MTIDPVKIPQNVYVEDRIIGPVTLRQIMIILGGAGISYAIWAGMQSAGTVSVFQAGIAWTPCGIAVLFAFVKINGISLFRITLLAIERVNKPSRRTWQPRQGIYVNFITKAPAKSNKDMRMKEEQKQNTEIEELSRVLDQGPPESALADLTEEDGQPSLNVRPASSKPVKREKISADTSNGASVDDVTHTKTKAPPKGGLLRDIIPPPSHA